MKTGLAIVVFYAWCFIHITEKFINPGPAEPGYALSLQTLDLHCLSLRVWICINNLDQVIWLAEN